MTIDGRNMNQSALLMAVREQFASTCTLEHDFTVLTTSKQDAVKVKAFTSMSGCDASIVKQDDYYTMKITGGSCRCG